MAVSGRDFERLPFPAPYAPQVQGDVVPRPGHPCQPDVSVGRLADVTHKRIRLSQNQRSPPPVGWVHPGWLLSGLQAPLESIQAHQAVTGKTLFSAPDEMKTPGAIEGHPGTVDGFPGTPGRDEVGRGKKILK